MLPAPDVSFIRFPNIFKHLKVPFKLTSIVLSTFSSVIVSMPQGSGSIPASHTKQSSFLKLSKTYFLRFKISSFLEISHLKK